MAQRVASPALRAALKGNDPSDEQWRAITAGLQPQVIVAGAGSGKTAVMTARIVWLVEEQAVRPSSVLGLTFTNKASMELEERLTQALARMDPHPREHPTVMTYHAFAAQVVRDHGARLGIAGEASLLSDAQKWQLLLGVVNGLPRFETLELRHPLSFIPQTLTLADQCSDHLISPEQLAAECERLAGELSGRAAESMAKRRELATILRAYIDAKRAAGRIDYGDQIWIAVRLLREFPDLASDFQQRYGVVLLDEYQDTNPAQKRLIQLICPPGSAVTAVGDARQAIYAWRGATMYNLLSFAADFPNADGTAYEHTSLAANYRSGRRIVSVANSLIDKVPAERRPGAELEPWPHNGEGFVGHALLTDQTAEAEWIADTIESLRGQTLGGEPLLWRDFAILVRKRRYMDHIVGVLERRDIPVEMPELGGLLKVPPVVDVVAWMRVLSDPGPSTNRWAARILMGPRFRIHYRDLAPVARWAAGRNFELTREAAEALGVDEPDPGEVAFSLLEALGHADEIEDVSDEARRRIAEFLALRDELRASTSRPLMAIAESIIDRTGLGATLQASPSRSAPAMLRNLQSFAQVCSSFSPLEGDATLGTFLDYLDAAEESEDTITVASTAPTDSVKVMTVHGAKGLEFEVVFLPALAAEEAITREGWQKGSIFPDVRQANPLTSTSQLPPGARDDAAYLPGYEGNMARYTRELRDRAMEDERRLLYVAVTRARRHLYCSAAWWYGAEPGKGPSVFWSEIAEHPDSEPVRADERDETNPMLERMSSELVWPPQPDAGQAVMGWIALVDDLLAGRTTPDEVLADGGRDLYAEHLGTIASLADPRPSPPAVRTRPASMPATTAARLASGKETSGAPGSRLPERPSEARRLGIEVHAWIEERARGLTGLAEEDALEEPSLSPDPRTVQRLRDNYVAMGYDGRPLARLDTGEPMAELPFTLKVAGMLVRGRIDAVFEAPGGLEIVDFKTGAEPGEPDPAQLELYAEALAALGYADGEVTVTYAFLSTGQSRSWSYTPGGLDRFESKLSAALGTR